MEIIVCIKQVPGTNKAEVDPVTGVIKRDSADSKMNPYDLFALETALKLREQKGGTVTVLSMGPPQAQDIIREAYSMGADKGVLLTDRRVAGSDVLATSLAISESIKAIGHFDLILCGKQTTDGDTAQVGPEVAEMLGIPSAAGILEILEAGESITARMDMPTTIETIKVELPCLLSVEKDIHVPRLPSYLKKKASANREIRRLSLDDLSDRDESKYGLNGSPTQVKRIFPPPVNDSREMWTGSGEELADKIYNELSELKFVGGGL
jgi:electron transfer flavoprotein beta subunit